MNRTTIIEIMETLPIHINHTGNCRLFIFTLIGTSFPFFIDRLLAILSAIFSLKDFKERGNY